MDDKQVEQQLTSRRLEIAEIKLQVQQLLNAINKITQDLQDIEAKNPSLVVSRTESDSFLKGDTVYHKLKHAFSAILTVFKIKVYSDTAEATITIDCPTANTTGIYYYDNGTLRWLTGRLGGTTKFVFEDFSTGHYIINLELGDKLGFFNAAPASKQTLNAYTADVESSSYTGIANNVAGTVYARVVDLNVLRTAYETLRASYDDLRTKLQNTTLVG